MHFRLRIRGRTFLTPSVEAREIGTDIANPYAQDNQVPMEADGRSRIGEALILIHQSISRGIHMSGLYSRIFTATGVPKGKMRPGFADYVRSLTSVLLAHHLAEDEVVFPLFRELTPGAPFEHLAEEHLQMIPLANEIRRNVESAVGDSDYRESLERIDTLLDGLARIWRAHIAVEEDHFASAKVDAVLSVETQARVLGQIGEANQKHSGPDYLVVPFTLFNLPQEDRASLAELLPPVEKRDVIPAAWREKWQPMSPFLLV
jgi:hypothetical protein